MRKFSFSSQELEAIKFRDPGAHALMQAINNLGTIPAGGTAGQVLKKSNEKDFDVEWTSVVGIPGINGTSSYTYIAYASDADGTDFTLTFNPSLLFIAFLVTTSVTPPVVGDFAGLWSQYKVAIP
jgi:hypothetical protein